MQSVLTCPCDLAFCLIAVLGSGDASIYTILWDLFNTMVPANCLENTRNSKENNTLWDPTGIIMHIRMNYSINA